MKIQNKKQLQQIAINQSSDIVDIEDFMNIYKKILWIFIKYILQKNIFLVNDTTLSSDNPLRFRKNLLQWTYNKILAIDNQNEDEGYNMISTEKLQKYQPYHHEKFINIKISYR